MVADRELFDLADDISIAGYVRAKTQSRPSYRGRRLPMGWYGFGQWTEDERPNPPLLELIGSKVANVRRGHRERHLFRWIKFSGGPDNLDTSIPLIIGLLDSTKVPAEVRLKGVTGSITADEGADFYGGDFTTKSLVKSISALKYFLEPIKIDHENEGSIEFFNPPQPENIIHNQGRVFELSKLRVEELARGEDAVRKKITRKLKSHFVDNNLISQDTADPRVWRIVDGDFRDYCESLVRYSLRYFDRNQKQEGSRDRDMDNTGALQRIVKYENSREGYTNEKISLTINREFSKAYRDNINHMQIQSGKWMGLLNREFSKAYRKWLKGGEWILTSVEAPKKMDKESRPAIRWKLHTQVLEIMELATVGKPDSLVERKFIEEELGRIYDGASSGRISQVISDLVALSIIDSKNDQNDKRVKLYRFRRKYRKHLHDAPEDVMVEHLLNQIAAV